MTEEQIYELSLQAYIYGYPLVLMEITKQVYLEQGTPLNQFRHAKTFPSPKTKIVVRPNVDTLYSLAWLDLSIEPLILSVPDTEGRFYLLQLFRYLDGNPGCHRSANNWNPSRSFCYCWPPLARNITARDYPDSRIFPSCLDHWAYSD